MMDINTLNSSLEMTRKSGHLGTDFLDELVRYKKVILRGAGFFGTEIGKQFINHGVPANKLQYWDVRAEELNSINSIEVVKPFPEVEDKADISSSYFYR